MFAVTIQSIVTTARGLMNDTDSGDYRWSDANFVLYANAAQRDLAIRTIASKVRAAYQVSENLTLGAGTKQNLSDLSPTYTPLAILNVTYNVGPVWVTGSAYNKGDTVFTNSLVYRCATAHTSGTFSTDLAAAKWVVTAENRGNDIASIHEANMETLLPNWQNAGQENTEVLGVQVQSWMEDQHDRKAFHVYPQQPDSSYKMVVGVNYAAVPAALTVIGDNIILGDEYQDAMMDYMIHMAYLTDNETDQNGNTQSSNWFNRYLNNAIFGLR